MADWLKILKRDPFTCAVNPMDASLPHGSNVRTLWPKYWTAEPASGSNGPWRDHVSSNLHKTNINDATGGQGRL